MIDWMMDQLTDWFSGALLEWMDILLRVMGGSVLVVPNVTRLASTHDVWSQMLGIVNVCYVIVLVAGAAIAMTHETVQSQYALKDLAPRLVLGFVAANFSFDWCNRIFELAQALLDALTAGMLAGVDAEATVRAQVEAALDDATGAALLLMVIIIGLVAFLIAAMLFGWIVRMGVLLVLAVAAPLALACHGLPQLDPIAKLWWRSLLGTLAIQVLQALVLLAGIAVFLTPSAPIADQMHTTGGAVLNLFVLVALLWTAVKVPGLVRRYILKSGGGNNIGSYLVRVVLVQQLARSIMPGGGRRFAKIATRGAR